MALVIIEAQFNGHILADSTEPHTWVTIFTVLERCSLGGYTGGSYSWDKLSSLSRTFLAERVCQAGVPTPTNKDTGEMNGPRPTHPVVPLQRSDRRR